MTKLFSTLNSWSEFERALRPLDRKEKGDAFEELIRLYLLSDPVFITKLASVWHHTEVPQKVIDALNLPQPEIGVDLVAQTREGDYWAIQCKYHQDRTGNVGYSELKTFFAITEASAKAISRRLRSLRHFVTVGFIAVALSMGFISPVVAGPLEDGVPEQMKKDHAIVLHYPPDGNFSLWRMENEAEAILGGYLAHGVAEKLSQFLNQTPQVRTLGLYTGLFNALYMSLYLAR